MVVPNREIANSNIISSTLAMFNSVKSKVISKDIQMGVPRGKSNVSNTSSRASSMMSKASSIKYSAHIEAQSADSNWANQTKEDLFRLLYATPLGRESNIHGQTNNSDSVLPSYVGYIYNTQPQALAINIGILSLSYEELQLGNSNS